VPGPPTRLPDALRGLELDHVAVAVRDVDAAGVWDELGFERRGEDELVASEGVRVRTFDAGGALIELIAPVTADSPLHRFLERRGPGLHHLALRVRDVAAAIDALRAQGATFVEPVPRRGRGGTRVAFVHPSWTGGTLVELVEHG
jgi:methylmalonyl-CoA/ethylmalonyl-CoA epimerase